MEAITVGVDIEALLSKEITTCFVTALQARPYDFTFPNSGRGVLTDGQTGYAIDVNHGNLVAPYRLTFTCEDEKNLASAINDFKINHMREKFNRALMRS